MFLEIRTARMWRIMQARWFDTLRMRVLPTQRGQRGVDGEHGACLFCHEAFRIAQMRPVNE
jgi:hypothetical protein